MDVSYLKKATGNLTAEATVPPNIFILDKYPGDVLIPVEVKDSNGVIVTNANVKNRVSKI